jgi:predicted transcriptional regulator
MTTEVVKEALGTLGSQKQIAAAFGVTPMAVSLWLSDKFPPSRVLELYNLCGARYDLKELLAK